MKRLLIVAALSALATAAHAQVACDTFKNQLAETIASVNGPGIEFIESKNYPNSFSVENLTNIEAEVECEGDRFKGMSATLVVTNGREGAELLAFTVGGVRGISPGMTVNQAGAVWDRLSGMALDSSTNAAAIRHNSYTLKMEFKPGLGMRFEIN